MATQPTTEQLQRAVGAICKVIGQIPCYHVFEKWVVRRFGQEEAEVSLLAMSHNAALDSSLLNLRCFNEFFKPDGRQDDIRAYHFPGLSMPPFLSPDDEQAINKHLAHLTIVRSDMSAKPWLLDKMTLQGLHQAVQFLDFIDTKFPLQTDHDYRELRGVREAVKTLMQKIDKWHGSPGS